MSDIIVKVPKREGGFATLSVDSYNKFLGDALTEVVTALNAEDYEPAAPMSVSAVVEHRITIVSVDDEYRSDIDVAIEFTFVFSGISNPVDADDKPISLSASVLVPTTSDDHGTTALKQGIAIEQTAQNLSFSAATAVAQSVYFYPLVINGDVDTITAVIASGAHTGVTTALAKQADKSWKLTVTPGGSQATAKIDYLIEFTAYGQTIQKKVYAIFA